MLKNVVIASGMRFPSGPSAVRDMKLAGHFDYLSKLSKELASKTTHGKTLDNTVYKTEFIRNLGGFDHMESNAGQDSSLSLKVMKSKEYTWAVNYSVISVHLKLNSYMKELESQRWYARSFREIYTTNNLPLPSEISTKAFMRRLANSPIKSVRLLRRTKNPLVLYFYPAFCLFQLIGLTEGKRYDHKNP